MCKYIIDLSWAVFPTFMIILTLSTYLWGLTEIYQYFNFNNPIELLLGSLLQFILGVVCIIIVTFFKILHNTFNE